LGEEAMSGPWSILAMCVWAALVAGTVIQNIRLLRVFRNRYPQLAQKELPAARDDYREKAFYFFRKRAIAALRPHPDLWRERQRFVILAIVTIGYWLACGAAILTLGLVYH
jgi:hypothetical protein